MDIIPTQAKEQNTIYAPTATSVHSAKKTTTWISVIIVNYNAGQVLEACVASLLNDANNTGASANIALDIIVVDNASTDSSLEFLDLTFQDDPRLRIIRNQQNLGFAKACNIGTRLTDSEFILYLNPDCVVEQGFVKNLLTKLQASPKAGMAGGLLLNPDGSEQPGGRRAVPTPWRTFVRMTGLSVLGKRYPKLFSDFLLHRQPVPAEPVNVEAISGACMLVRRSALEQVGLMSEDYFVHCEDLDWCMQFRKNDWQILFVPQARLTHLKGVCSKDHPLAVEWHKHKGMLTFYRRHFKFQYPGILMWCVRTGVCLRFCAVAVRILARRVANKLAFK